MSRGTWEFLDRDLEPGTQYTYRIVAFNEAGSSAPSSAATGRTKTITLGSPAALAASYGIHKLAYLSPGAPRRLRRDPRAAGPIPLRMRCRNAATRAPESLRVAGASSGLLATGAPADV